MQADIEESEKASAAVEAVGVEPACKACGSTSIRRSRRTWLDHFATVFGYYPYRCRECHARFHLIAPQQPERERRKPWSRSENRGPRSNTLRRELLIYALALLSFAALVSLLVRDHD